MLNPLRFCTIYLKNKSHLDLHRDGNECRFITLFKNICSVSSTLAALCPAFFLLREALSLYICVWTSLVSLCIHREAQGLLYPCIVCGAYRLLQIFNSFHVH